MSVLKIASAAFLVSSLAAANLAVAGNGGVSSLAPGKNMTAPSGASGTALGSTPGGASGIAPGKTKPDGIHTATGIGQSNPNKLSR